MNIGDLVRYGHPSQNGLGIVTYVACHVEEKDKYLGAVNRTCTVLWADGTISNHSSRWLIRIEEIK